jgi:hypothetical protein
MSRSAFLALAARLSEHAIASFRANGMEDRA